MRGIIGEKILRKNLTKVDVFKKILRSVSQNNNIVNGKKIYARYILKKKSFSGCILSRRHRVCLLTGKFGGVLKGFNFSRHQLKAFILENKLTNMKQHNW